MFNIDQDMVSSMGKIRQAGFTEPMDTERSLLANIDKLRALRILPAGESE